MTKRERDELTAIAAELRVLAHRLRKLGHAGKAADTEVTATHIMAEVESC